MTYDELMQMYLAGGGVASGAEGDLFLPQPVTLPDGTRIGMGTDGTLTHYTGVVPGTGSSGGGAYGTAYNAGGPQDLGWQANGEGDNWRRSLLGALAVGVGGPALGVAGNALAGSLGGAASAPLGAEGMLAIDGVQGVPGMSGLDGASMAAIDGSALGSSVAQQEALLGAAQGGTAGTTGWGAAAPVAAGGGLTTAGILGGTAGGAGAGFAAPTLGGAAAGTGAALGGVGSALGGVGAALASNPALVGAALGGLAGAAGSGPETTTSAQDLPEWLRPYAQSYLARADALSQQPFQAYPGQRVANLSGDQQTAMTQIRDLATVGDPLVNQARGQQGNVIGGEMLGSNPYIDAVAGDVGRQMGDAYAIGTRAKQAGNAALSGNLGSAGTAQALGRSDEAFGRALGSTMNNLYYGNYSNERAAQDAASRSSLGFGTFGRGNTEGLLNSGAMQRGVTQDLLGANYDEWQQRQAWPQQQLGILGGAINPGFGSQQTRTDPGVSTWQGILGGAATGAGIGRSIYGGQSSSGFGSMNFGMPNGRSNLDNYLSQFG